MGATLVYAKVVDGDTLQRRGGGVARSTESVVRIPKDGPSTAAPFWVMRSWAKVNGSLEERWRIADPHGRTVHDGLSRTVVAGQTEVADEIMDLEFEYADDGYQLILEIEGREVARADFRVEADE